jgi:CubicO group peptidase (beta-lactamase class C family)
MTFKKETMPMSRQPSSMSRMSRRSMLGLLGAAPLVAGAAVAVPGAISASAAEGDEPPPVRDLDRMLQQLAAQDKFSGTVLVAHAGRPVLARAFGMADKERSIPNRLDTIFSLASTTKPFTALAVAQLVQAGKVGFHETLGTYLEGFPAQVANVVTVHQLLTHTAGLGYYEASPAFQTGITQWKTAAEVLDGKMAIIRGLPLLFTPGTRYSYSNSAFVVLGAIVAQASGQPYWDYVRQHIFEPAGMTLTDFYTRPQVVADRNIAHSYASDILDTRIPPGTRVDITGEEEFIGTPDGSAYSTAADMISFAHALLAGRLLNPSYLEILSSGKVPLPTSASAPAPPGQILFTCYGLDAVLVNNRRIFGHAGDGPGIATNIDIFPDLDWVAVLLSNYDNFLTPIVQLERQLVTQAEATR